MSSLDAARDLMSAVRSFNRDRLVLKVLFLWLLYLDTLQKAWERDLMARAVEEMQREMDREIMGELDATIAAGT